MSFRTSRRVTALHCIAVGCFWLVCLPTRAFGQEETSSIASTGDAQIERGRYLARHVAMCVECHTPRDPDGDLIESKLFDGAKVLVKNPLPNNPWAAYAPQLAGLPGYQPHEVIHVLTEGKRGDDSHPRPPMPPFRMTREDATAVVQYLQSLSSNSR